MNKGIITIVFNASIMYFSYKDSGMKLDSQHPNNNNQEKNQCTLRHDAFTIVNLMQTRAMTLKKDPTKGQDTV